MLIYIQTYFTCTLSGKFVIKLYLNTPTHLKPVATLTFEILYVQKIAVLKK